MRQKHVSECFRDVINSRCTAQPEGTHTKIVFEVSTINKLVSHKISTPPVVSHKVSTPALYQIVMYLTFIVFCTRALPCPPLKMRCTHGRLPRRPSPPGQLTATEMTPRPLQNALAQWLPAPAVISARLGAGRLQQPRADARRQPSATPPLAITPLRCVHSPPGSGSTAA